MKLTSTLLISCLALVACGRSTSPSPASGAQAHAQSIYLPPAPTGSGVRPDTYLVTLQGGVSDSPEVQSLVQEQGFEITDVMEPAPGAPGPCGRVAYGLTDQWNRTPEQVLAQLTELRTLVFGVDPLTGGVVGGMSEASRPLPSRLLPDPPTIPFLSPFLSPFPCLRLPATSTT